MNEQRTRTTARAVLEEYERRVDVAADLEAVLARAASAPRKRRRWVPAAVAVVTIVAAGVVVTVGGSDRGAVRTTDTAVSGPGTGSTAIVDSPPTATTGRDPSALPGSTTPEGPVVSDLVPLAPVDLFGDASHVASTLNGVFLSDDGTNWFPVADGTPFPGPAYLIDGYVVTQPADVWGQGSTNGPITIVDADGAQEWVSPKPELGSDPVTSGHQLHGVGWMNQRPVFVVSQYERMSPEEAYELLLLVDLRDGAVTNLGDFGGWEAGVNGVSLHGDRVVVLRNVLTSQSVRVLDGAGANLFEHALTPDSAWALSGGDGNASAFAGHWDEAAGASLEIVTVDPVTFEIDERSVAFPDDAEELASPCMWPRIEGDAFVCTATSGPVRVDLTSQQVTSIPASPDATTVIPRVEPLPGAIDSTVAASRKALCGPHGPISMPNAATTGPFTMYAARHDDGFVGVELQRSGITIGSGCGNGWDLLSNDGIVFTVITRSGDNTVIGVAYPTDQPLDPPAWLGQPTVQEPAGGDLDATVAVYEIPDSVELPEATEEQPLVWTVQNARTGTTTFAALDPETFSLQ